MAKRTAIGATQLGIEIATSIKAELVERAAAEQRSLRAVVERALAYYFANVPVDGGVVPAKPKPKKADA